MDNITVPASSFSWILLAAKNLGLDVGKLLLKTGLDPELVFSPDAQLPLDKVEKFRAIVRSHFPYDTFALEVGQSMPVGELGIVDYICLQSTSLGDAMENLSRYFRLVSHPNLGLTFNIINNQGVLETAAVYQTQDQPQDQPGWFEQQSVEFTFSIIIHRIQYATGLKIKPVCVFLRYAEAENREVYENIFGPNIIFNSPTNRMILAEESLLLKPLMADFRLYQLLRSYADDAIIKIPDISGIEGNVLEVLKDTLQTGDTSIKKVASLLCMSSRTLHRKLKEAGTSYNALREKLRCELARTYLSDPAMSISDISYLLGFSETSVFHRAFKRWTGITPQYYRQSASLSTSLMSSRDSR